MRGKHCKGPLLGCGVTSFLPSGKKRTGESAVFAPRCATGKWQTTICLPIKRSARLPNPAAPWATGVAARNLCVGLRG
jgi:hypothetical protein